jgi:hypothetical protein
MLPPIIDREKVKKIYWQNDPIKFDLELFSLGRNLKEFIVPNPNFALDLSQIIKKIPETNRCVVWYYKEQWIAKKFNHNWRPEYGYYDIQISANSLRFNFLWNRNSDLNQDIEYEFDPYRNYSPSIDEAYYELVWYMDPRFVPEDEKVWVVKCKNHGENCLGIKDMGYITPKMNIEYNPYYTNLNIDLNSLYPAYYFIDHVYFHCLDKSHIPDEEKEEQWVVKMYAQGVKLISTKFVNDVNPLIEIIKNPDLPDLDYEIDYAVPYWDLEYIHMWMLDKKHCGENQEMWAFKAQFVKNPVGTKVIGECSPIFSVEYNKELPKLNYTINHDIPWWHFGFVNMWMLDKRHCENAVEDIWAVKITATDDTIGTKIIGDLTPNYAIEYNDQLPDLKYDVQYVVPYHDLAYEHVWMLDEKHTVNLDEKIWAFKVRYVKNVVGSKIVNQISPIIKIEINKDIKGFRLVPPDVSIQYHDFEYKHVWMLDKEYSAGFDIWAVKLSCVDTEEEKLIGDIAPEQTLVFNSALKDLKISIDYKIPYHDRMYEHVWYLDKKYSQEEKIWAAKLVVSDKVRGEKEMGVVVPDIQERLDVVFISYYEPNAEENWARVKQKAPYAKRVDGVNGIFEAHKASAKLAESDMFYVVDGDAWLEDDWQFDYQPGIFDRDCAYVWHSVNPINGLSYGYGGVKLFAKKILMKKKKWQTLDMTTGIMPKLKIMDKISNISAFNTDEFSTWKSAFRECVKLYANLDKNSNDNETKERISIWKTVGSEKPFGSFALEAAVHAEEFYNEEKQNTDAILKINDRTWLQNKYNTLYGNKSSGKTKNTVRNRKNS